MACLIIRSLCVNAAVFTVPWWPAHAREMWPTLLQLAVHLALLVHAPRQNRLMRARWAAQLAERRSREQ
jgi:poly-beta-hydroxyalkanoate depolymerase